MYVFIYLLIFAFIYIFLYLFIYVYVCTQWEYNIEGLGIHWDIIWKKKPEEYEEVYGSTDKLERDSHVFPENPEFMEQPPEKKKCQPTKVSRSHCSHL